MGILQGGKMHAYPMYQNDINMVSQQQLTNNIQSSQPFKDMRLGQDANQKKN